MSQKKDKAKRKAEAEKAPPEEPKPEKPKPPVTLKQLAQANERVAVCQQAYQQARAQAQAVMDKRETALKAAVNEQADLTARAKEQEAK